MLIKTIEKNYVTVSSGSGFHWTEPCILLGDFVGAELKQVGGEVLGIEQFKFLFAQEFHKENECDFAGIGRGMKHAFAAENFAEGHAVEATQELIVLRFVRIGFCLDCRTFFTLGVREVGSYMSCWIAILATRFIAFAKIIAASTG